MAKLNTQRPTSAGTTTAYVAAGAGGDTLDPGTSLLVKNGSGISVTVTVASPGVCSQGGTHPLAVAVAAGTEALIGPFPAPRFANPVTGLVDVTYSAVATVTVAALQA